MNIWQHFRDDDKNNGGVERETETYRIKFMKKDAKIQLNVRMSGEHFFLRQHIKQKSYFYGTHKLFERRAENYFYVRVVFGKIPDAPKNSSAN